MPRKILSRTQSVEAACILFEINTDKAPLLRLAAETGLCDTEEKNTAFCRQWYGFVHAAVTTALMVHAPNIVLADYLRTSTSLLMERGLAEEECAPFIDSVFTPYMELLGQERQKECPQLFFSHLGLNQEGSHMPPRALALISGAMAMTLAAMNDKLETYELLATEAAQEA